MTKPSLTNQPTMAISHLNLRGKKCCEEPQALLAQGFSFILFSSLLFSLQSEVFEEEPTFVYTVCVYVYVYARMCMCVHKGEGVKRAMNTISSTHLHLTPPYSGSPLDMCIHVALSA